MHARDLFDWGEKTTANVNFCVKFDGTFIGVWFGEHSGILPVTNPNDMAFSWRAPSPFTGSSQQTKCKKFSMGADSIKSVVIKFYTYGHGGQAEFYACENEDNGTPQCDDAAKRRYIPASKDPILI